MKMLVLDGNSIINRAFYGVRPLTTKDGQPTNAVFGFLTMFGKIKDEVKPDAVAIAFDMRAPTFRHLKYADYKGKRKGMPDDLACQMDPLKELLSAMGYKLVTAEGWEADDIIGTLAASCREKGCQCVIATGDRDTLQLVGGGVTVRLMTTKGGKPEAMLYDEEAISEIYGVTPRQMIELKAIQGDTSDNIPGVPGIGEKGAGELIKKFGTLDGVYENIGDPSIRPAMRAKLEAGRESAYLSRWLGTVATDAPVDTAAEAYIPAPMDVSAVRAQMIKLELFSLLDKMKLPAGGQTPAEPAGDKKDSGVAVSFCSAQQAAQRARSEGKCDIVYECADGFELTFAALCSGGEVMILDGQDAAGFIKEIAADGKVLKRTHDVKKLWHVMEKLGAHPDGVVFDTMLAAYLVNPSASEYSLERLCAQYAGDCGEMPVFLKNAGSAGKFSEVADALEKAIDDAGLRPLMTDIELPLAAVLADMESLGVRVDGGGIERFGQRLTAEIADIEREIYELAGYEFNLNSPKQIGEALFEKLMLPGGKRTKTGYSTSAEVLEGLRGVHPAVDLILKYRALSKLNSTYCVGLKAAIAPDGRIHTSFNQTETRTGRISSAEPNLQNIPVRTELGRELRRYFTAKDGWTLVDADYSQIELRVLAHMAGDRVMTDAFIGGEDIHAITASQVFGVSPEEVTGQMRSRAKAVNFGIVYGISAFSLGKDIGVATAEAQKYINEYMEHYGAVGEYMKRSVEKAKERGYAETIYGRRRYLPELGAGNHNTRAFGERVARNMPIQGTAADIIKLAMVRVHRRLSEEGMSARLIMQVHDELIIEAPLNEAERVKTLLCEEMTGAAELAVPLTADAHIGKTWLDAKG